MKFPNKVYDVLKWLCLIALPAVSGLVSVILSVWHICPPETITAIGGTIDAVSLFIGALIGVSTAAYNKANAAPPDGDER